jgi:hypothetical protein
MPNDLTAQLQDLDKDFAARKAELENQLLKKKGDLIKQAVAEFSEKLEAAVKFLSALPDDYRITVLHAPVVQDSLKLLQIKQGKGTGARKARTPKISDEKILAFLSSDRSTGEVQEHFGWSAVTSGARLKKLLQAKKVSMRKEGTSKFWKRG